MGWAETKNSINSNLSEPLNFNNYMDDIAVYGKNGYTMAFENSAIWQDMLAKSLSLFGYTAIHAIVYDRLTDEDVDVFIGRNGRLGQCFNAFYQIDDFPNGNIEEILKMLTSDTYNKLEIKLQAGINRYVNRQAEGDVGAWLYSLFGIESLKNYHTVDELLADTTYLQETAIPNTSLWFTICMMGAAITALGDPTNPAYLDYVRVVATSSPATLAFVDAVSGQGALETFFNTQEVVDILSVSKEAIWGIAASMNGFDALLQSDMMMQAIGSNEVGVSALMDGFDTATRLQPIVERMKTNATALNEDAASITTDMEIMNDITYMKEVVETTSAGIDLIVSKAARFVDHLINCWANKAFVVNTVGTSLLAAKTVCESEHNSAISAVIINSGQFETKTHDQSYYQYQSQNSWGIFNIDALVIIFISVKTTVYGVKQQIVSSPEVTSFGTAARRMFHSPVAVKQMSNSSNTGNCKFTTTYIELMA